MGNWAFIPPRQWISSFLFYQFQFVKFPLMSVWPDPVGCLSLWNETSFTSMGWEGPFLRDSQEKAPLGVAIVGLGPIPDNERGSLASWIPSEKCYTFSRTHVIRLRLFLLSYSWDIFQNWSKLESKTLTSKCHHISPHQKRDTKF